jgi:(2Fe-2S) ferredoxin
MIGVDACGPLSDILASLGFTTMPKRERYLFVCTNRRPDGHPKGSCAGQGSEELLQHLKGSVAAAKLALTARPCGASCLDLCWEGPVVGVMPDMVFWGRVSKDDVPAIVEALKSEASVEGCEALKHKVLRGAQFDDPGQLTTIGLKKG